MSILDVRCATPGCWHYTKRGVIYCICHMDGKCQEMSDREKGEWRLVKAAELRREAAHLEAIAETHTGIDDAV